MTTVLFVVPDTSMRGVKCVGDFLSLYIMITSLVVKRQISLLPPFAEIAPDSVGD